MPLQTSALACGALSLALLHGSALPLEGRASVAAVIARIVWQDAPRQRLSRNAVAAGAQRPNAAAVALVSEEALKSLLPELPGWQRTVEAEFSWRLILGGTGASARYQRGEAEIGLVIDDPENSSEDRALFSAILKEIDSGKARPSPGETLKRVSIRGFAGYEQVVRESDYAVIAIKVADRFGVMAQGNGTHLEELRKLIESIDLEKLAKMK